MKLMKRIAAAAAAFLVGFYCRTGTVEAAPEQMPDGNVFDAEYYAAAYPDVVAVLGADPAVLYQHYLQFGVHEGRQPYAAAAAGASAAGTTAAQTPAAQVPAAAPVSYAQKQLDVFSTLVLNGRVIENGYVAEQRQGYIRIETPEATWKMTGNGIHLSTSESQLFDAARYAAENPDIVAAYGSSKDALWQQYKAEGVYTGRTAYATTYNANAKLQIIQIAQQITNPTMTAREKVRAVHDWIINSSCYDLTYSDASQTIEGLIYNHTAVCAGYAKTFAYFMEVLDIPCELITGYTYAGESHAWNRVALDGQWYYIDVTWDDPVYTVNGVRQETLRDTYFLISEAQMAQDHYAVEYNDYY